MSDHSTPETISTTINEDELLRIEELARMSPDRCRSMQIKRLS